MLITVAAVASKGMTVGASFSEGVAGMGLSREGTQSKGKSVTFALDPDSPGFDAAYNEIMAANTVDDLAKLAARRADLLGSTTTSHGTTTTTTTSASLASVGLSGRESSSYNEEETRDASGVSHKYEGGTTSGVDLTLAGKEMASTATTDQFTARSARTIRPREKPAPRPRRPIISDPWKTSPPPTINARSGPPRASSKTDRTSLRARGRGKKLTDDSYARLAEMAKDPGAGRSPGTATSPPSWIGRRRGRKCWRRTAIAT